MRIALVTLQYPPAGVGGIGTYVAALADALADAGHDVTVVCASAGQQRSSTVEGRVRVERFPLLGPRAIWDRLVSPHQALRVRVHHALSTLRALRRLEPFDVIEAPEWKAQGLLVRLARRGAPIVHLHLAFELQAAWNGARASRGWRIAFALERWTARLARARSATSEQTRRLPDGTTWLSDHPVEIVAPPLRAGPWPSCPPADRTAPVVLFVGRLERRKAPEVLVEALGLLVDEVPDVRAVFVGRVMGADDDRSYAQVVGARAQALGVVHELHGPTADPEALGELYARARVVAVPSRFETLSMVVFEAMACGRPAVMTDQVGAVEWLGDDLPELVVPAEDARALADALRPHLLDADHAAEVGQRGRQLVASITGPASVVADRVRLYEQAIGARP